MTGNQQFNRSNAVLVRVRIKKPRASMKDKVLSQEVCDKYGIDPQSARVSKDVFKMTEVNRPVTEIRAYLREKAMPWSATEADESGKKKQDAVWLLNGREVKEFADKSRSCKEEFEGAGRNMADNWDDVLADIQSRLGGAYNPSDLPTREEFLSQFKWETIIEPLTDVEAAMEDYRLKLPEEVAAEQIARFQRNLATKVSNVVRDMMRRIAREVLGDGREGGDRGMLAGLEEFAPDPNDKRKGRQYKDTRLYGNTADLRDMAHKFVEVFPDCEELKAIADRLDTFCDEILPKDPEVVRNDPLVRKRVAAGLRGLLDPDKMPETETEKEEEEQKPKKSGGFEQFV